MILRLCTDAVRMAAVAIALAALLARSAAAQPELAASGDEAPASAAAKAPAAVEPKRAQAAGREESAEIPAAPETPAEGSEVYVPPPPDRLLPGGRMGGSTRGPASCASEILALVPEDHVGLTTSAQPTLYWFLGEATDCRIDFVLNDPRSTSPRIERPIPGPHAAGIHALSLAELGVSLEPGLVYTWFVNLVPDADARSKDVISGGQIERIAASGDASAAASSVAKARALGQKGLWYDALAALQQGIVAAPESKAERVVQSRLLATQGLATAAPAASNIDVAAPPPTR